MTQLVKNCKGCNFYDDGHGNCSYMSVVSCGPPSCNHPDNVGGNTPVRANIIPLWCPLRKGAYIKTKTETVNIKLAHGTR